MQAGGFWKPFVLCLAATPFCLVFGMASAGAGHGDYIPATILFPFTLLSFLFFDSITIPLLPAIAQFPLYGIIFGLANLKNRLDISIAAVLAAHLLAIFACFLFLGERFYGFLAQI